MSLLRCSGMKKRTSDKFLSSDEFYAVGEVLDKSLWLDHLKGRVGLRVGG